MTGPFASDRASRGAGNMAEMAKLPPTLGGDFLSEVPDPEALHTIKSAAADALLGKQNSRLALSHDEARVLGPMVEDLRDALHQHEAAKIADAYYANRKGAEAGFESGRDMAASPLADEGANAPESVAQTLARARYAAEPPDAQAARGAAFRLGAKAKTMDLLGKKPIENPNDLLDLPIFGQNAQAVKARANLFDSPADAGRFETWLAGQHHADVSAPKTQTGSGMLPISVRMAVLRGVRSVFSPKDLIQTGTGSDIVQAYADQPGLMGPATLRAQHGQTLLDYLTNLGVGTGSLEGARYAQALRP